MTCTTKKSSALSSPVGASACVVGRRGGGRTGARLVVVPQGVEELPQGAAVPRRRRIPLPVGLSVTLVFLRVDLVYEHRELLRRASALARAAGDGDARLRTRRARTR